MKRQATVGARVAGLALLAAISIPSAADAKSRPCKDLRAELGAAALDYSMGQMSAPLIAPLSTDTEVDAGIRCWRKGPRRAVFTFRLVIRDYRDRGRVYIIERGSIEVTRRRYSVRSAVVYRSPALQP